MIYSFRIRLLMLAVVIVAGCLLLFYRLWFLQIEQQEVFIAKQPVTDTAKQRVPGVRGRILDRNGVEFATTDTNMEVGLNLAAVESAWKEKHREDIRRKKMAVPTFTYNARGDETTDIIAILNEMVFPELDRLKLYRRPSSQKEAEHQKEAIIRHYLTYKQVIPYPYEKNLLQSDGESFKRFTAYAENVTSIPGITLTERPKRRYPMKAMAGHLIGYLQENRDPKLLPAEELQAQEKESADAVAAGLPKKLFFGEADDFGMAGLEKTLDEKLRPKPGERIWRINEHGRLTDEDESRRREPLPGADVFMTIDARIQMIAETALRDAGVGRGAIVIMDPNSGAVLAMASVPSYDPSIFISPKDEAAMKELYEDRTQPVQARALRADFPGSTFKLMTAIAGSIAGKDSQQFNCPGFIDYGRPIACWIYRQQHGAAHGGPFPLPIGIKYSCNCFFFQLGNAAGIDRICEAASYFGFGDRDNPGHSGIEVPELEANGYVASQKWWKEHVGGNWPRAETAYISIGQGKMAATPLQICMLGAAVANGGKIYQPTLIDHIEEWQHDREGNRQKVVSKFKPKLRANLLEHGVKKKDMDAMREGMRLVVNDKQGTGKNGMSKIWTVAGKTGTAQRDRFEDKKKIVDNRTWFMSFAPFEDPKIAVCVLAVNGKAGGSVPAPIAKRVIEQTLSLFPGNEGKYPGKVPKVQPLEPAKGTFRYLEKPDFKDEDTTPDTSGDDEEEAPPAEDETDQDTGPAAEMPEMAKPFLVPRAQPVLDEDDVKTEASGRLQPVQFRLKSDPPNPPRLSAPAVPPKAH